MHDLLFERQREMRGKSDDEMIAWGVELADELGLNTGSLKQSLQQATHAKEVEKERALASEVGARGTPTFFINGVKVVGAQPYPKFQTAIDEQIELAEGLAKDKKLSGTALYKAAAEKNEELQPEKPEPTRPDAPEKQVDVSNLTIDADQVLNPDDYDVTIFMFSDYQCPFCKRGHDNLEAAIAKTNAKVRVVYKHFPLPFHKQAQVAALAAMAAGEQGKFWEMSDFLFEQQKRLAEDGIFMEAAKTIGLDTAKFEADMKSKRQAWIDQIDEDKKQGQTVGVKGTPRVFHRR